MNFDNTLKDLERIRIVDDKQTYDEIKAIRQLKDDYDYRLRKLQNRFGYLYKYNKLKEWL